MKKELLNKMKDKLNNMADGELFCVYIDFPFCKSKCEYCIYNSIPYLEGMKYKDDYVKAVMEQLDYFKQIFEIKTPDAIYFGGGTPSLWSIDELNMIRSKIKCYDKIRSKKSETHPSDLNDERIKFYAEQMKLDVVSIGVQSFNKDSCTDQKRIWVNEDRIKHIINEFHRYGVFVNIDLVALFNGDTEKDWKIFEEDIRIACEYVKPDIITSIPNYKTKLIYIEQIPRFRKILRTFTGVDYFPLNNRMLSLDTKDIEKYGENDHWIATKKYWEFHDRSVRYSSSHPNPLPPPKQITLSFGGAKNHVVYSYISSENYVVYSAYNNESKEIEYYKNHIIHNIESSR